MKNLFRVSMRTGLGLWLGSNSSIDRSSASAAIPSELSASSVYFGPRSNGHAVD